MDRIGILPLVLVSIIGAGAAAQAGPCAGQITSVEAQIRQAQAKALPGGSGAPSAPQSVGAQLHHQPTPSSVETAEHQADAVADEALARARQADAAGDTAACAKALQEAKDLYGLQ